MSAFFEETLVLTEVQGFKHISKVVPGDKVATADGNFIAVTQVKKHEVDSFTFLKTDVGVQIRYLNEPRFLVEDQYLSTRSLLHKALTPAFYKREATDLEVPAIDNAMYVRNGVVQKGYVYKALGNQESASKGRMSVLSVFPEKSVITEDLLWAFGVWLSLGTLVREQRGTSVFFKALKVSFSEYQYEMARKWARIMRDTYEVEVSFFEYAEATGHTFISVCINSLDVVHLFVGLFEGLKKQVPAYFYNFSDVKLKALLTGYCQGKDRPDFLERGGTVPVKNLLVLTFLYFVLKKLEIKCYVGVVGNEHRDYILQADLIEQANCSVVAVERIPRKAKGYGLVGSELTTLNVFGLSIQL